MEHVMIDGFHLRIQTAGSWVGVLAQEWGQEMGI